MKDCVSPNVRESKTVLDSGFQSLSVGFGFWIPISSRIPDSWAVFWFPQANISRILESKFPYMYPAKQTNFVVPRIWTLNLTESRGESKNDSKGEGFVMAAAINAPRGRAFVQKKKRRRICLLCNLPYIGWCVVKIKLLIVAWAKNNSDLVWELLLSNWFYYLLINNKYTVYKRHK